MRTGFVNIFKKEGDTSTFVVNRLKRLFKTPCGHMGTLDPLAEGVLPVGVGNATRLFDYFLSKTKTYRARFRFGFTTETLDRESAPVPCGGVPSAEKIAAALPQFTGDILQVPPTYSAVSVNGKRSYELARRGHDVDLPAKTVRVERFCLLGEAAEGEFEFEIVCGGGTYIRSLARDLGAALETGAYMTALRRTASGVFTEATAVPLDLLNEKNRDEYLIPTETVLPFPVLEAFDERLFQGVRVETEAADGIYKIYKDGAFYGLATAEGGVLRPEKKLC